jgi:hypothetical protein
MLLQTGVCLALLLGTAGADGPEVVTAVGASYAVACTVSAAHLLRTAYRRTAVGLERLAPALLRSATAAMVMLVLVRLTTAVLPGNGRGGALLETWVGLVVGVASYLGGQRLLGSPELSAAAAGARRLRRPHEVPA